jgi:multidrug efflux pump subunit AcrB
MSEGGSYDLTLLSSDIALLRKWMPKVSDAMRELPELVDIDAPSEGGTAQVMLHIDREAARRLGVDMQMIAQVLNSSFSQRQIATLYDRLNQYRVVMELEPQYTADPAVLDQVQVIAADGSRVPLSAFTRFDYSLVDDRLRRKSMFAAENVGFGLAPGRVAAAGAWRNRAGDGEDHVADRHPSADVGICPDVSAQPPDAAAAHPGRAGRGVPCPGHSLRELGSSPHDPVDAAFSRDSVRCWPCG